MQQNLRSFFIKLFIFSAFTAGILVIWQNFMPARFQGNMLWAVWVFFVFSTGLLHYVLLMAAEKEPRKFVGYFMGLTAIKLFGYLIIITIYALLKREAALGFTLWFLCLYLLYSGFEVVMLMKRFKK